MKQALHHRAILNALICNGGEPDLIDLTQSNAVGTRKAVNFTCAARSQVKTWWKGTTLCDVQIHAEKCVKGRKTNRTAWLLVSFEVSLRIAGTHS